MAADWHAGRITLDLAMAQAEAMLERDEDNPEYFGAVLDLAVAIEDELPTSPETSFLLERRIGHLAYRAAENSLERKRLAEARSLVLAGPERWQREQYWLLNPEHDAMVSYILALSGRRAEAVARLQGRTILNPPADRALEDIRAGTFGP